MPSHVCLCYHLSFWLSDPHCLSSIFLSSSVLVISSSARIAQTTLRPAPRPSFKLPDEILRCQYYFNGFSISESITLTGRSDIKAFPIVLLQLSTLQRLEPLSIRIRRITFDSSGISSLLDQSIIPSHISSTGDTRFNANPLLRNFETQTPFTQT